MGILHLVFACIIAIRAGVPNSPPFESDKITEHDQSGAQHEAIMAEIAKLAAAVADLAPTNPRLIYETRRSIPLRAAPHKNGRKVGIIPECAIVEQMDQDGRWLQVIYLDLDSGSPQTGWIYKRSLVPVDLLKGADAEECADAPLGTL
jgi:hypothetical protein